jgi:hypothetical protein
VSGGEADFRRAFIRERVPRLVESSTGGPVARIELDRDEIERRDLPFVCVKCGRPAHLWKSKWFNWESAGRGALRALGPVAAPPKMMEARLPMCRFHRNHWLWRGLFGWGVGGVLIACFFIGLAAVAEPDQVPLAWRNTLGGFFCVGFLGLVLWVPVILVLNFTSVRPVKMTDDGITLAGVSSAFVGRVKEYRRLPVEERKAARRAGRRRGSDGEG